jgi:hypothetical protein
MPLTPDPLDFSSGMRIWLVREGEDDSSADDAAASTVRRHGHLFDLAVQAASGIKIALVGSFQVYLTGTFYLEVRRKC